MAFRRRDADRSDWRSTFGFYSTGTFSRSHGARRRLQSFEGTWGRIDHRRADYCWRLGRIDFWANDAAARATEHGRNVRRLWPAAAAGFCRPALARPRHALSRLADPNGDPRHLPWNGRR